jgi:hypothetical protein
MMFRGFANFPGRWLWCGLGLALIVSARADTADWLNAGPLFDDFDLTLSTGHRTEVAGPLFYSEQREGTTTWAIPPFFSHFQDPAIDAEEWDFFYPVMTFDRYGTEHRWQIFQVINTSGGMSAHDEGDEVKKRFSLFPIYMRQRSTNPSNDYTAVLPFYGHLKNRIFRDESFFVMWPIYIQSKKRDIVTDNYCYPFVHLRHGDGLHGWQVWPLVGREHKDVTTRTNGFNEIETIGGHDEFFALWPFFHQQITGVGTENPAREQAFLPLYTWLRSPQRDATTIAWPFFNIIDDRAKKYREWEVPWPFIVIARGEGKTITRVFPLFSHAHSAHLESDFYLFPVYKYNRVHSTALDRDRTRILLYLFSNVHEKNTETGMMLHRADFWPLYTYRKDFNGNSRLQILSILEPILPNNKSIERDWSPIYALWRAEKNPRTGASSQSLLWNLYRHESTPLTKKCSLLFGLFQYQSGAGGKQLRLFYIPVLKTAGQPKP